MRLARPKLKHCLGVGIGREDQLRVAWKKAVDARRGEEFVQVLEELLVAPDAGEDAERPRLQPEAAAQGERLGGLKLELPDDVRTLRSAAKAVSAASMRLMGSVVK